MLFVLHISKQIVITLLAKVSATPLNEAVHDWLDPLAASILTMWHPFPVLVSYDSMKMPES
jgi:hypothetical protein